MKISLNVLKQLVDVKVSDEELIRLIGARLVEVEGVIDETHKYDNIYIVKVVEAEKIPETHLSLCKIDAGDVEISKVEKDENGLIQVVCGAPNVRAGMLAVWIAPGATVPASVHEDAPFIIGKRKMLGKYESNGMLAGADELDLGDDHSGIVEISEFENVAQASYLDYLMDGESNVYNAMPVLPGTPFAELFDLNDKILEIENKSLTHRPDCFGLIGFAREVAGILGEKFKYNKSYVGGLEVDNGLKIEVEDAEICPRYSAVVLEKNGEEFERYLTYSDTILCKSGMRPIDLIVDATNLVMLNTGQPLHAFDYDKFVAVGGTDEPVIRVRLAKLGEKLMLLGEKEIELNENDIVICSNDTPVALAGAMGGESTKIDKTTKRIILESATFSLYNLRKTQMAHGIFSEAITRFTKGQPAYQTLMAAGQCVNMLPEFNVKSVSDCYMGEKKKNVVKITTFEINGLLGTKYDKKEIIRTLENVGFKIKDSEDSLEVTAPEWRTDIHIKEDIIEEIGRLNGYDNILPVLPLHATAEKNKMFETKKKVRDILVKYGANEVLTYSFVSGKLIERAGQETKNSYKIVNSISPELQYVRQSIVPSLLEKAYSNEKLPVEKFAIFEMNKVYLKELGLDSENVPVEKIKLGFLVAERKNNLAAFYRAKKYVEKLLNEFKVCGEYVRLENVDAEARPFEKKRAAEIYVNGEKIGVVGEFKNSVRNEFKLAPYLAGFEIDLEKLMELSRGAKKKIDFSEKKAEDLTVETDKSYTETLAEVSKKYPEAKISAGAIYQVEGETKKKMTFHIER